MYKKLLRSMVLVGWRIKKPFVNIAGCLPDHDSQYSLRIDYDRFGLYIGRALSLSCCLYLYWLYRNVVLYIH